MRTPSSGSHYDFLTHISYGLVCIVGCTHAALHTRQSINTIPIHISSSKESAAESVGSAAESADDSATGNGNSAGEYSDAEVAAARARLGGVGMDVYPKVDEQQARFLAGGWKIAPLATTSQSGDCARGC